MTDDECVAFLQWALPRLGKRWPGYRRVRRQVCKRIGRRLRDLGLADPSAYRLHLEAHREEWTHLDALCRITISRFCRDRDVFTALGEEILPVLARAAVGRGDGRLRCWSAGCASGEEPYTLALLWALGPAHAFPDLALSILATDAEPKVIARATTARYPLASVRDVPQSWREAAFERLDGDCRVRQPFRAGVKFRVQDIRAAMPDGAFDLLLCRNLVFTYEDEPSQRRLLIRLADRLRPEGFLVIGRREVLPQSESLVADGRAPGLFRKAAARLR